MVLEGQFTCDCCHLVSVRTPFEYCDHCVEEIVAYLAEEDEAYWERQRIKHEDYAYSRACEG